MLKFPPKGVGTPTKAPIVLKFPPIGVDAPPTKAPIILKFPGFEAPTKAPFKLQLPPFGVLSPVKSPTFDVPSLLNPAILP
jgi:hypothetical protein